MGLTRSVARSSFSHVGHVTSAVRRVGHVMLYEHRDWSSEL